MLLAEKYTTGEFAKKQVLFRKPLWLVKILHFEYWPLWLIYIPLTPYLLWLMVKCRSIFFYRFINPSVKNGGLQGESKKLILDAIDQVYKPVTFLFRRNISISTLKTTFEEGSIKFPVIAKPDIGEQGRDVEKIDSWEGLSNYIRTTAFDFIIQEFVDYPVELAVFFIKIPGEINGKVTSVTQKQFLSVCGNGRESVEELVQKSDRARFQSARLYTKWGEKMKSILPNGQQFVLEVVGNHCKGTMFLDGNFLINEKLNEVFNRIASGTPDFYYGRYDLKVSSIADLYEGKNIRIVEWNGAGAIPAHIFDPDYSLTQAWKDILKHWRLAGQISSLNKMAGVKIYGS